MKDTILKFSMVLLGSLAPRGLLPVLAAALGLAVASIPDAAHAATVLKVDVAQSVRLSEWVVRAHVTAMKSVDLRPQGDSLYTDVSLVIDAVYRGKNVPKTHVMRLMGGVGEDGLALTVPGMPQFTIGEDVVLFLERVGSAGPSVGNQGQPGSAGPSVGNHVPCGLDQGVWRVAPGVFGYPVVYRKLGGLSLMAPGADGALAPAHETQPAGIKSLAELIREIAAAR